jgi:hypothetical protein
LKWNEITKKLLAAWVVFNILIVIIIGLILSVLCFIEYPFFSALKQFANGWLVIILLIPFIVFSVSAIGAYLYLFECIKNIRDFSAKMRSFLDSIK